MGEKKEKKDKQLRPRIVVDLPKEGGRDLWHRVRMKALEAKKSVSEWLFEAIRHELERLDSAEKKKK